MAAHVGNAVYLIYTDDTESDLLGFVYPGAEFTAKKTDRTEVGVRDDIQQAANLLLEP